MMEEYKPFFPAQFEWPFSVRSSRGKNGDGMNPNRAFRDRVATKREPSVRSMRRFSGNRGWMLSRLSATTGTFHNTA
jgi:hypothetical protein